MNGEKTPSPTIKELAETYNNPPMSRSEIRQKIAGESPEGKDIVKIQESMRRFVRKLQREYPVNVVIDGRVGHHLSSSFALTIAPESVETADQIPKHPEIIEKIKQDSPFEVDIEIETRRITVRNVHPFGIVVFSSHE